MMFTEDIQKDFKEVITYSQGISDPKIDDIVKAFEKNKAWFYHLFGDQLIYEFPKPVSFNYSIKEQKEKFDNFVNRINDHYDLYTLSSFIDVNGSEAFYNNVIEEDFTVSSEDICIKKGSKMLKAFKYFVEDEKLLRKIQDEASVLIQENKIEGTLCFSIHPLDFLSTSENTLNWRSCHALDGEYKAGNLSYLMDGATFITYIKTNREVKLPNFPSSIKWNNKKTRTLMFVSDERNMIFAGRTYPNSNKNMLNAILNCFESLMRNINKTPYVSWTDWSNFYIKEYKNPNTGYPIHLDTSYLPMYDERLKAMDELVIDMGNLHYNDLLYSTCYTPYYSYYYKATSHNTHFTIGSYVPCLECGEVDIDNHEYMRCIDCEEENGNSDNDDFCHCVSCNRHMRIENAIWVNDDTVPVCRHCARDAIATCLHCGEKWLINDLRYIYDDEGEIVDKICKYCDTKE